MATRIELVAPGKREVPIARESSRRLARCAKSPLKLSTPEGDVALPASAVRLLKEILSHMAAGRAVTLVPVHTELTTQQAADLLNVSRPFVVSEIEAKRLPCRRVGAHRRVLHSDLLAYKSKIDSERLKALDDLAAQAQELKLGY